MIDNGNKLTATKENKMKKQKLEQIINDIFPKESGFRDRNNMMEEIAEKVFYDNVKQKNKDNIKNLITLIKEVVKEPLDYEPDTFSGKLYKDIHNYCYPEAVKFKNVGLAFYNKGTDVPLIDDEQKITVFGDKHGDIAYVSNILPYEDQLFIAKTIAKALNVLQEESPRLASLLGKRP